MDWGGEAEGNQEPREPNLTSLLAPSQWSDLFFPGVPLKKTSV